MRLSRPLFTRFTQAAAMGLLLGAPLAAAAPSQAPSADFEATAPITDERASYSFLRTLEGTATVAPAGQGVGEALELNQPLLTGDQVRVGPRSRVELALSDRNRLHLDAGSTLLLEQVAFSGDRDEKITVLRLDEGEMLLEISEEALGDELPQVVTANTTVYFQQPGQYRIETSGGDWTRVITRRGFAEVVTDRGSTIVREEESILARGDSWVTLELGEAEGADGLERWSEGLADRAERAARSSRYVEPHLAYDAAPLDEAGDWVEVESVRYWRPRVEAGWRPYWQGRWAWTPSGYTWVSYEPWGWVPYHYGRWCSLPGYGWAWRPGGVYSPAWVYWNWSSGWAGWVPMGYYSHFYDPWNRDGFRFGVYGWAGGGWGLYSDWNFAPVHCFRDRNFRGQLRTGHDRRRESGQPTPPKGLLTTDTRDFRPDRIDRTGDLLHQIQRRHQPTPGGDLPDVTDFVGRKGRLPDSVARVVAPRDIRPGDKERGRIRDVSDGKEISGGRRIAETPVWRERSGDDKGARRSGGKATLVDGSRDRSGMNQGRTNGSPEARPRPVTPEKLQPRDARGTDVKAPVPRPTPRDPGSKDAGSGRSASSGEDQQRWKERSGESAPVQRVVGSVRRQNAGTEDGKATRPPTATGNQPPKEPRTTYSYPSEPAGRSPSRPPVASPAAPRYAPKEGAPAPPSPRYVPKDGGARSQTARPAPRPSPEVKSAPSQPPSGAQRSQASRGSQGSSRSSVSKPPGRSSSGTAGAPSGGSRSGSRSSQKSAPPPPPPPEKKDGGGR
jgi:hypothetical protein